MLETPEAVKEASHSIIRDWLFWWVIMLAMVGYVGRTLVSTEPLEWRKIAGELLLTVVGAVGLYALGVMNGMSDMQVILFGVFGSLGGVHTIQRLIQVIQSAKGAGAK